MKGRPILVTVLIAMFALAAMGADSCDTTTGSGKGHHHGGAFGGGGGGSDGGGGGGGGGGCTPGYSPCLAPASDYDCDGGTGDGPEYTGQVQVTGSDPYELDTDGDGIGCE